MPISRMKGREGPSHRVPCEPVLHVEIGDDVYRIVKQDELVLNDWVVESQGGGKQQQAQNGRTPAGKRASAGGSNLARVLDEPFFLIVTL